MVQQRLLEIAIAEFGARGLEGASTRGIAQAAGTAMSSITYHYGGKEGLYLAAANYIAERIGAEMAPALALDDVPSCSDAAEARALVHRVVGRFVDTITAPKSAAWSLFITREQMEPTEAFERIYGGLMKRMLVLLVGLVRAATGRDDAQTAEIAVITMIGQVVALRASRATVLKLLDRREIDAGVVDALKHRITANIDAMLDRLIEERQELP